MREITFEWEGPFGISDNIPKLLRAAVGLYLFEYHSEILYIGKSEEQGGFKRAKDHFRSGGDRVGRCVLKGRDKNEVNLWVGFLPEGEDRLLISDAENLLIFKLQTQCNEALKDKYYGGDLHIKNEGDVPPNLPRKLIIQIG